MNVNLENKASFLTIEAAAFIVCLDHASPDTPVDRFRQFLFADTNRWYDKTLQHVVCPNGVSASVFEHAALDGVSVRPLLVDIAAAVVDPPSAANEIEQPGVKLLHCAADPLNISADSSFNGAIMQCRQQLRELTSLLTFASLTTSRLGVYFLQKHKCPIQSGVQLAIQLACRRFYGYTLPAYETVSMAHFRKGRVEVNAIIGPAMMRFLDVAASESRASSTTFKTLLYNATTEHNRSLSRAIQGKAYNRHMLALEWMLEEGESRPALFDDIGYAKSKPGKVIISHIPLGGLEGGFAYPVPGSILVYYDIQGER